MVIYEIVEAGLWTRIFFALFCGLLIGLERQIRGKPVGIRTSILVCMGSMLFIYLGHGLADGSDPTRVLGQLITGIGFLGAGVIMNREGLIVGMTSAAVIWLLAGIGAAIGLQEYGVAIVICFVSLFVLTGVQILEDVFKMLRIGAYRGPDQE